MRWTCSNGNKWEQNGKEGGEMRKKPRFTLFELYGELLGEFVKDPEFDLVNFCRSLLEAGRVAEVSFLLPFIRYESREFKRTVQEQYNKMLEIRRLKQPSGGQKNGKEEI